MTEKNSQELRSRIMKSIKSESKLENKVSRSLWKNGIRFRKNDKNLIGKPDLSIKKYKIVVFIDSCFWHFCPIHGHMPKTNIEYWEKKLRRNKKRDAVVNTYYIENNWNLIRIWEHQLKKDNFEETIEILTKRILKIKASR